MAVRAGNIPRAAALAEEALAQNIEHPGILNLAAHAALERNEFERGIALLNRARELAPNDFHVLNSLGIAFKRMGRLDEALAAFDAAVALKPNHADLYFNKGTVFEAKDDMVAAQAAYEQAIAQEPLPDALGRLSYLTAMQGDYEAACAYAERAVQGRPQDGPPGLRVAEFAFRRGDHAAAKALAAKVLVDTPNHLFAKLTMAKAEVGAGDYESARPRLQELLAAPSFGELHALALHLMGRIEEQSGNFPAAFAAYAESKGKQDIKYASKHATAGGSVYADRVARFLAYFSGPSVAGWRADPSRAQPLRGGPASHVFLVGFPRSGTTLLEKTLASHPGIATAEEEESLYLAVQSFILPPDGLERLSATPDAELGRYRDHYWQVCRGAAPGLAGKVFIDKMPLYSIYLPVIARMFPTAKILFALRDPRDVVLSCFRQQFQMSPAMYEFCNLERAARLYDLVMQLREIYRERLGLQWIDSRYEDLVADFEGSLRRVFAFIGVEWDEAVRDVSASARSRVSTTPSASQVARGLYDGSGAWRRYREQMAPVLPMLAPWVERFGYPKD